MVMSLFKSILTPIQVKNKRWSALVILFTLALSMIALLCAPLFIPPGYSWISHTISESAAQGLEGAWLARTGFLLFGLAVIWLSNTSNATWARGVVWLHIAFGVCMVSTAAFSHKPWIAGIPYDPIEDALHSFTATAMGFAFTAALILRLLQRGKHDRLGRILDIVALTAATAIPLLMFSNVMIAGLVQRLMFLISYVWYGTEALRMYQDRYIQPDQHVDRPEGHHDVKSHTEALP
jgi:hypothetical protein